MRPIDADMLVEYLDLNLLNECLRDERFDALDAVKKVLRKVYTMPTLDVAPVVHAKWVGKYEDKDEGQGPYDFYRCSNCGMNFYCDEYSNDIFADFCPDCGAKMEVDE